jgi:hypothetical protein
LSGAPLAAGHAPLLTALGRLGIGRILRQGEREAHFGPSRDSAFRRETS